MANTKMHPGAFRCYEAALPDEPMFVILGRDISGPATLRFWGNDRLMQGKTETEEDRARIVAALKEAQEMADWRARMIEQSEAAGSPPPWKLPRPADLDDGPPICMRLPGSTTSFNFGPKEMDNTYVQITDEMEVSLAVLVDHYRQSVQQKAEAPVAPAPVAMRPCDHDLIVSVGKSVREIANDLPSVLEPHKGMSVNQMQTRLHAQVERLAEAARNFTAHWPNKQAEEAPVADDPKAPSMTFLGHYDGVGLWVEGATTPKIAELRDMFARPKPPTMDSEPDNLAHAPEVPHHRFSVFHKGEQYAYARGLEVNPMHLPTALDAMAKSGWHLVAIFGQTDSSHIGFIFQKEPQRPLPPGWIDYDFGPDEIVPLSGTEFTGHGGADLGRGLEP